MVWLCWGGGFCCDDWCCVWCVGCVVDFGYDVWWGCDVVVDGEGFFVCDFCCLVR